MTDEKTEASGPQPTEGEASAEAPAEEAAGQAAAEAATPDAEQPGKAAPARSTAGVVALIGVLFVAILAGGGGWYLYQQVERLDEARGQFAARDSLESLATEQSQRFGELSGRISSLNETLENRLQAIARLENRLEDQQAARSELADRVDQLYRRMESETDDWRQAEAAYLARIAVSRVRFNGDIAGALEALEAADRLLAGLGGAGVDAREAVARATDRLLAAERAEIPAIITGLTRVAGRLDDLPLAEGIARRALGQAGAGSEAGDAADDWPGRLRRAWRQLLGGLEGLVTVSRDRRVAPLPDPEARFLLQQNLLLQIESARLAALRGEAEAYRAAVARVADWVSAYFDSASPAVSAVDRRLRELAERRVSGGRPDIADDLSPLFEGGLSP